MEAVYEKEYTVTALESDCFDRLKASALLQFVQEAAGEHSALLNLSWQQLQQKHLFWAIIRHRIQVTRWPRKGDTLRLQTWPMPTTRTAFPRSVVAVDPQGQELFRTVSLWVLMDPDTRAMVLPKHAGVEINGLIRGTELTAPGGLVPGVFRDESSRRVSFTDLDINGHMNNTRYMDWISDLLPASFHREHSPREITLCYLSEAREGDSLAFRWELDGSGSLRVDSFCRDHRNFAAKIEY